MKLKLIIFLLIMFKMTTNIYATDIKTESIYFKYQNELIDIPYPGDNNSKMLSKEDIIKNLPEKTGIQDKVYVADFIITGNRVFNKDEIWTLIKSYINKELSVDELYEVADIITDYYNKSGYILSYAYIPPQTVDEGYIKINIIEGILNDIKVKNQSDYKKDFIIKHFSNVNKDISFNIKDIEHILVLLDNYMDINLKLSFHPYDDLKYDMTVYVEDKNPYRFLFSIDNYGVKESSVFRTKLGTVIGNMITSGDEFRAYTSIGIDHLKLFDMFYGEVSYLMPFGYNGFRGGFSYGKALYHSSLKSNNSDLYGYSDRYSLYLDYPQYLTQNISIYTVVEISVKQDKDQVNKITDNQNIATYLTVGSRGNIKYGKSSYLLYSLFVDQIIVGGSYYNKIYNRVQYTKLNIDLATKYNASWFYNFKFDISAQVSTNSLLLLSDRFYIGGIYSVRGYSGGFASGDWGTRASFESELFLGIPYISSFIFADYGLVYNIPTYNTSHKKYTTQFLSAGVGIRCYISGKALISIDYGYPLINSTSKGSIYFTIGYEI